MFEFEYIAKLNIPTLIWKYFLNSSSHKLIPALIPPQHYDSESLAPAALSPDSRKFHEGTSKIWIARQTAIPEIEFK